MHRHKYICTHKYTHICTYMHMNTYIYTCTATGKTYKVRGV